MRKVKTTKIECISDETGYFYVPAELLEKTKKYMSDNNIQAVSMCSNGTIGDKYITDISLAPYDWRVDNKVYSYEEYAALSE